jgi:hypothetical protein
MLGLLPSSSTAPSYCVQKKHQNPVGRGNCITLTTSLDELNSIHARTVCTNKIDYLLDSLKKDYLLDMLRFQLQRQSPVGNHFLLRQAQPQLHPEPRGAARGRRRQ